MSKLLAYLVLFGAGQALVLGLGVLLRGNRAPGSGVLAAMLGTLGIWQGFTALSLLEASGDFLSIYSLIHFPAAYACGILVVAYGEILLRPERSQRTVRHLVRLAVLVGMAALALALAVLIFRQAATDRSWQSIALATWSQFPEFGPPDPYLSAISYGPRPLTILATLYLLALALRGGEARPEARRLRIGILFLTTVALFAVGLSLLAQFYDSLAGGLHAFGAFLVTIVVCGLYFLGQRVPAFLDFSAWRAPRRSRIERLDRRQVVAHLKNAMEEDRIYAVEDLSLAMLAREISTAGTPLSPEQLSEIINVEFGRNFNRYVNAYRIAEACRLLREFPGRSVLSIAMDVGFNSKSAFNAAFKQATGRSPGQYRTEGPGTAENS